MSFPSISPLSATRTILLVEDSGPVRAVVRAALERSGFTVLEASRGLAAIDLVRDHGQRIDLLLTDVAMPQMTGRRLVEEVRRLRADMPVVFMSGYADEGLDRDPADRSQGFLQKPFTSSDLVHKVRAALNAA